jgi:hypothetical protein
MQFRTLGIAAGVTLLGTGLAPVFAALAPVERPSAALAPEPVAAVSKRAASRDEQLLALARSELARLGEAIPMHDYVGIADFGLHASEPRFHLVDMATGTVRSFRVTHGAGSDQDNDGWLDAYSNVHGSLATSRGAYRTREWYEGKYGTSMRLDGLEATNDNALDRAIVMHPAAYASPQHVARWGRVGRSWGCLAFAPEDVEPALGRLVGGRLILAESYGIAADGSRNGRRAGNLVPLSASEDGPRYQEQALPGIY